MSDAGFRVRLGKGPEPSLVLRCGLVEDTRLSFAALGLLAYLLAQDRAWKGRALDLRSRCHVPGAGPVRLLRELEAAGYAVRRLRKEVVDGVWTGRHVGTDWVVSDAESSGKHHSGQLMENGSTTPLPLLRSGVLNKEGQKGVVHRSVVQPIFDLTSPSNKPRTEAGDLCAEFHDFLIQHQYDRVEIRRGVIRRITSNLQKWEVVCQELLNRIGSKSFRRTMRWYFEHHRERWVGTYLSMPTFCANYEKLRKARLRMTEQEQQTPASPARVLARRVD